MCVLKNRHYLEQSALFSLIVFMLIAWVPLFGIVVTYLTDPLLSFADGFAFAFHLLFEVLSANAMSPFVLLVSVAAGTNIALLFYFFRTYRPGLVLWGLPTSVLGVISSLIGIGCAACGAIFLTAISSSAAGILLALPFQAAWIGYFGVGLLCFSTWHLARAIDHMK